MKLIKYCNDRQRCILFTKIRSFISSTKSSRPNKYTSQLVWLNYISFIIFKNKRMFIISYVYVNLLKSLQLTCTSVMTYGAETLALTLKSLKTLRTTQWSMKRVLLGIGLSNRKSNTWIKTQIKVCNVIKRIAWIKWYFVGYNMTINDNRWIRKIFEWRSLDTTRSQSRPPIRWTDDLKRHAGNGLLYVQDREPWKDKGEAFV